MDAVDLCIGTVPIYEAGVVTLNKNREIIDMDPDDIFKAIENQAKEGVDFMTLHCGITIPINVDLDKIANTTHGFVGADLESLCKEAAMRVVRRILPEIQNDEEIPKEEMLQKNWASITLSPTRAWPT